MALKPIPKEIIEKAKEGELLDKEEIKAPSEGISKIVKEVRKI